MAKYASKGEPRSQSLSAVFKSCMETLPDNSLPTSVFRSAMIDFSAPVSTMSGDRRVAQTHELEVQHSTFDHYAARSLLVQITWTLTL